MACLYQQTLFCQYSDSLRLFAVDKFRVAASVPGHEICRKARFGRAVVLTLVLVWAAT